MGSRSGSGDSSLSGHSLGCPLLEVRPRLLKYGVGLTQFRGVPLARRRRGTRASEAERSREGRRLRGGEGGAGALGLPADDRVWGNARRQYLTLQSSHLVGSDLPHVIRVPAPKICEHILSRIF